jgi:phenylacetyl-CoA:acceptor oxidoreductase
MFLDATPTGLPRVTLPDVWFVYRTNPAISFWDTAALADKMARFPFVVPSPTPATKPTTSPTCCCPTPCDLESLQLIRIGGTKYVEQFWDHQGFALRQPAVARAARRATSPSRERAGRAHRPDRRLRRSINKGAPACRSRARHARLLARPPRGVPIARSIWDAVCRAASPNSPRAPSCTGWTGGRNTASRPALPAQRLVPVPHDGGARLRFELPYQERLARVGVELGRRLHENGMDWWDEQLKEYQALPLARTSPRPGRVVGRRRRAPRTIRSGCSRRAACSTPGAATSACR